MTATPNANKTPLDNATLQLSASKSSDGMTYGYASEIQRYQLPNNLKFQDHAVVPEIESKTVIKKRRVDFDRSNDQDMIEDESESETPDNISKVTPVLQVEAGTQANEKIALK